MCCCRCRVPVKNLLCYRGRHRDRRYLHASQSPQTAQQTVCHGHAKLHQQMVTSRRLQCIVNSEPFTTSCVHSSAFINDILHITVHSAHHCAVKTRHITVHSAHHCAVKTRHITVHSAHHCAVKTRRITVHSAHHCAVKTRRITVHSAHHCAVKTRHITVHSAHHCAVKTRHITVHSRLSVCACSVSSQS